MKLEVKISAGPLSKNKFAEVDEKVQFVTNREPYSVTLIKWGTFAVEVKESLLSRSKA
jgi:hypothetical protein